MRKGKFPEKGSIMPPVVLIVYPWHRIGNLRTYFPEITRRAVDYIHLQSRKNPIPSFLYFSITTTPHQPVSPSDDFKGKSGIAPLADFVMETDWSAWVRSYGQLKMPEYQENTLIIFTADNGHSNYTGWEEFG